MCGIAAILSSSKQLSHGIPIMRSMLESIAHRGPDGEGVIKSNNNKAIFGHRRLAVIDLDNGLQPMTSHSGRYTIVFNGEIYNYREIAIELKQKGVNLKTNSDTEVLLRLLIDKGAEALNILNGMFAFIFYDNLKGDWIAARDHFGIKPLYYTNKGDELIFASEIKALFKHPAIISNRNDPALYQYMAFQLTLKEKTLFSDILKLEPGHMMFGNGAKIKDIRRYWQPSYEIDYENTEQWFEERVQDILLDSVDRQTRSDVPLGTYLSGGIDSSLVTVLATKTSGSTLPMFHGKFNEGKQFDESRYAKKIAASIGGSLLETVPTAEDFVSLLPNIIHALDEPLAGPGVFPQYFVSQLAAQHVKVVLGGQGGDELFGGYARYCVAYLEQALKGAIYETNEEGNHLVALETIVPNLAVLKQYTPMLQSFWNGGLFDPMDKRYFKLIDRSQGLEKILHPDLRRELDQYNLFEQFSTIFNGSESNSYINKMTYFDQQTLLPALLHVEDRMSMSASIESRVPILDHRLAELMASIPPKIKFASGRPKSILKKICSNHLPKEIINRKDKMGFPVPLSEWMKGGIVREYVCDTLLSRKSIERSLYTECALESMVSDSNINNRNLWGALSLEIWHQVFLDG